MSLPLVATEFWIGTEPEIRFNDSGRGCCKFRVKAVTRVKDDSVEGGWRDGKTLWATANVWDGKGNAVSAQNAVESLKKNDLVVISGRIYTRDYEVDGNKRISVEIDVEEIGPSLRFRTTPHGASNQTNNRNNNSATSNQTSATTAPATTNQGDDNEPPF